MIYNELYIEKENHIATLYINRPEKRNAFTFDMWNAIPDLLKTLEEDSDVKVVILRGVDDTSFSAGADISEFRTIRSSVDGAGIYNEANEAAIESLGNFSKPTIAMVQGFCIGGGCEIAVACDFRFSDTTGKFGITPAKLGLIYSMTGTKNLVNLVGSSNAKDILFSARIMNQDEAFRIGLINQIYSPEELVEKTYEYAALLARNAQLTIRGSKKIINEILNSERKETDEISDLILSSYVSEDYKEGINAFIEKRKPTFKYC